MTRDQGQRAPLQQSKRSLRFILSCTGAHRSEEEGRKHLTAFMRREAGSAGIVEGIESKRPANKHTPTCDTVEESNDGIGNGTSDEGS